MSGQNPLSLMDYREKGKVSVYFLDVFLVTVEPFFFLPNTFLSQLGD